MKGRVGIDVGGTFTDAVLMMDGHIIDKAKVPTQSKDLLKTILSAIDALKVSGKKPVEQITVSTTLVTNAILERRLPEVELCLLPGHGMKLGALSWPVPYNVLQGSIDYRGREIQAPNHLEWQQLVQKLSKEKNNTNYIAIIGKFSHRNKIHEEELGSFLQHSMPNAKIALGHLWGQSNFYRRSLTTYLNLASFDVFTHFANNLENAVKARGCHAPIFVLKADGGVLPLSKIRPVESIYSGPTASVLGALAQSDPFSSFVVVDIGGTTTDLGLVLSGTPLLSSHGARIGPFSTLVRSLAVRSVPVGGDSVILKEKDGFSLAHYRSGPAYCLGGDSPTPTDAMCYLGLINYGNRNKAEEALFSLLPSNEKNKVNVQRLAESILDLMVERINLEIKELQKEWQDEPAYKVWSVLHPHDPLQFHLLVSGGAARGISEYLGKRVGAKANLGRFPEVSNAIGAAMAKPTFSCTLHLDTYLKRYRVEENGEQGEWYGSSRPYKEIDSFLKKIAEKEAIQKGIDLIDPYTEAFDFFPIVQGFQTVGQVVRGAIHVSPGVIGRLK